MSKTSGGKSNAGDNQGEQVADTLTAINRHANKLLRPVTTRYFSLHKFDDKERKRRGYRKCVIKSIPGSSHYLIAKTLLGDAIYYHLHDDVYLRAINL